MGALQPRSAARRRGGRATTGARRGPRTVHARRHRATTRGAGTHAESSSASRGDACPRLRLPMAEAAARHRDHHGRQPDHAARPPKRGRASKKAKTAAARRSGGGRAASPIKGEKKAQASGAARRRPRAATSAHERARTKTEALTKRLSPACSERRGCGRTKTSYAACAANTARDFGYARSAGLARKSWSSRRASRPACRTWT